MTKTFLFQVLGVNDKNGKALPALYKRYYPVSAGLTYTVIALAFFVLLIMSDKPEFSNTIINNEGLWERLNLIFMYVPLPVVSIRQIIRKGAYLRREN